MRNYLKLMLLAAGTFFFCTAMTAQTAETPAQKLMKRLAKIEKKGVMIGHQDDPMYGTTWSWDENRSDVLEVTGDYPAIMGFDLGEIELGQDKNLDGVPFDRLRKEAVAHYLRGGIVTLSWHPHNPVTGKNAWDPSGQPIHKILHGGEIREKFLGWLETVASFIKTLKTPDGKQIPVIFRPWHEMNGGWFWWGKDSCTPAEYLVFYRLTHDILDDEGLRPYVAYAWSPNLDGKDDTAEKFMSRYPGDDYVNIYGIDVYEFDNSDAHYTENLTAELNVLVSCAKQHAKIAALTETGCRGIGKKTDWFMNVLHPILKEFKGKISYALFWRNDYVKPDEEAYLPGVGSTSAPDFKKFKEQKDILFLQDIKKIK